MEDTASGEIWFKTIIKKCLEVQLFNNSTLTYILVLKPWEKQLAWKAPCVPYCIAQENGRGETISTSSTETWKSTQIFKTVFQKSIPIMLI